MDKRRGLSINRKRKLLLSVKSNDDSTDEAEPRPTPEKRIAPAPSLQQKQSESTSQIPVMVPIHQQKPKTPERPPDQRNVIQYSPPFLYSQAPESEVYWDDNTPQMRKHREKMKMLLEQSSEEGRSPVIRSKKKRSPMKKASPPKPKQVPTLPGHNIEKAMEALHGLMALTKEIEEREKRNQEDEEKKKKSVIEETQQEPEEQSSQQAGESCDEFSDDDALLLSCCNLDTDRLQGDEGRGQPSPKVTQVSRILSEHKSENNPPDGFESDHSFDEFLSQLDETEIYHKKDSAVDKENAGATSSTLALTTIAATHPTLTTTAVSSSIVSMDGITKISQSSRPVKKFRSADDGLSSQNRRAMYGVEAENRTDSSSLTVARRRNHSEQQISQYASSQDAAAGATRPKCTQEEIQRKKKEALLKKQQSRRTILEQGGSQSSCQTLETQPPLAALRIDGAGNSTSAARTTVAAAAGNSSSSTAPPPPARTKCTQEQIERKRHEAMMKKQLSQMRHTRDSQYY
eukprot:TRINITY_DN7198_c0_g1_i2.p1 TRINITY_DN7198_c0_g1~~TRINITY_DN7198_c0_g1_i2.p1  ORF type:complete len:516 (-),score=145.82 TRINITY_DN7198_c0_g1_i2:122-1669(-)